VSEDLRKSVSGKVERGQSLVLSIHNDLKGWISPLWIKSKVGGGGAPGLLVEDVKVGKNSQTACSGSLDARALDGVPWCMEPLSPGTGLHVDLKNITSTPVDVELEVGFEKRTKVAFTGDWGRRSKDKISFMAPLGVVAAGQTWPTANVIPRLAPREKATFETSLQLSGLIRHVTVTSDVLRGATVYKRSGSLLVELTVGHNFVMREELAAPASFQNRRMEVPGDKRYVNVGDFVIATVVNVSEADVNNVSVSAMADSIPEED